MGVLPKQTELSQNFSPNLGTLQAPRTHEGQDLRTLENKENEKVRVGRQSRKLRKQ